jgi:hypothetical protein
MNTEVRSKVDFIFDTLYKDYKGTRDALFLIVNDYANECILLQSKQDKERIEELTFQCGELYRQKEELKKEVERIKSNPTIFCP